MDSLEDFEKFLAEEKKAREKEEDCANHDDNHSHRKHRRHHKSSIKSQGERERKHNEDRGHHRSKRSRHCKGIEEEEGYRSHKYAKISESRKDMQKPDDDEPSQKRNATRDVWMEAPTAIEYDFTQRGAKKVVSAPPPKPNYDLKIHRNELNHYLHDMANGVGKLDDIDISAAEEVPFSFGDSGSQWRMMKLKAVYHQAERSGKPLDEIAVERFGNLREFDAAREEQIEMDRRQTYGEGYVVKEKPSGELFKEREMNTEIRGASGSCNEHDHVPLIELAAADVALDSTALNRMKAQLMKAQLRNSPNAAQLEKEYNEAVAGFSKNSSNPGVILLGPMESRMLAGARGEVQSVNHKRGRERGMVEENEGMSIEDMVREERRTRGQAGGEAIRAAERIVKDTKFDADLDYMDDNAHKLALKVQKSEINLRNTAISDIQKINRILDNCQLCHHEDTNQPPIAPIASLATRVYLTLPTEPELSEGGAVIVPIQHRSNLLECDDDEWEEIRNFMKSLTRMYHDQGRDVIFYENAAAPHRKMHAAMQVVPLPYSLGEIAPAFFREAILSSDEEWTQHRKLIDTAARARGGLGKQAFRRTIAKEMPYFHAWFEMDGGLGHIVEDLHRWPRGDLFAREVIGGMLGAEPDVIKRQGRWTRHDPRVDVFRVRWRKFDWTRILGDG